MPLDGSGNYQLPPGTEGVADTPIESLAYNTFIHDLRDHDLNVARPITRGGTGGTSPTEALTNLGGEKAQQIVTNYDSNVWLSGSFYSDAAATASPLSGHRFVGVSIVQDVVTQANIMLEAFDLDSTPPGARYTRTKKDGAWVGTAPYWVSLTSTLDTTYVKKSGDQMSGDLQIAKANPAFSLFAEAAGQSNVIGAAVAGKQRWLLYLGEGSAESGSNAGSNFALTRFDDAGAPIAAAFTINRATGNATFGAALTVANGLGVTAGGFAVAAGGANISGGAIIGGTVSVTGQIQSGGPAASYYMAARTGGASWTLYDPDSSGFTFELNGFGPTFKLMAADHGAMLIGPFRCLGASSVFGAGGTGATFSDLIIDGGSAPTGGPMILLARNSAAKMYVGLESRMFGGTNNNDNLVIYSASVGLVATFGFGGGSIFQGNVVATGTLATGSDVNATGNVYGNTVQSNNWFMSNRSAAGFGGTYFFGNSAAYYINGNSVNYVFGGGAYNSRTQKINSMGFFDSIDAAAGVNIRGHDDGSAGLWCGISNSGGITTNIRVGYMEAPAYNIISDVRFKKNVRPASPKLDDVMRVKIVNFEFNDGLKGFSSFGKQIGVLDTDISDIWPSLIVATPPTPMKEYAPPGKLDPDAKREDVKPIREWEHPGYNSFKQSVLYGPIFMKAFQEFVVETRAAIEELRH